MPTCTFFGHRECPEAIRPKLRAVVTELIEGRGVELFYVGQQGGFDAMAWAVLRELAGERPHIRYAVVLEHMPGRRELWERLDYMETLLPEGIESVHPRYAIAWRNDWMLRRADYVGCVSGSKTDKSGVFPYYPARSGAPVLEEAKISMACRVEDNYELPGFDNFILTIDETFAEEGILTSAGKPDYRRFHPVLFEMPGYTYLKTGDTIGNCMKLEQE